MDRTRRVCPMNMFSNLEDRRMRTLEGIRYLINLDSAEIQQNFAGGVAPPDKVESEVDTT